MILIYTELKNESFQSIKALRNANLINIRPHVFRFGSPGGSLIVQLQDTNGKLIDESNSVLVSSISTEIYAHGYLKFDIETPLVKNEIYRINLVGFGGYTPTASAFVGFVKDFDLRKVTANYSPNGGFQSAFDIEIWERKMGTREIEFFDGFESSTAPSVSEDTFTIANNQSSAADVTGLLFTQASQRSALIAYSILRSDGADDRREQGILRVQYKPNEAVWEITRESDFDGNVGVTFTINSSGQVRYTSDNFVGQTFGQLRFEILQIFGA